MKRIFSTKDKSKSQEPSRRSSVSKPKAPPAGLQYFTYGDVAESNEPRVGDFPQHGDTVALGANDTEPVGARSRASKRDSEAIEAGHEDIFANAPDEPLAPEGPSRRSKDASRRSSRRMSRRGSTEGFAGPSSSRESRAISPERPLHVVNGEAATRQSTRTSARMSRRTSDAPAPPPLKTAIPPAAPIERELEPEQELIAPVPRPVIPLAQPALAAIAAEEMAHHKAATPPTAQASPVVGESLSQIPTTSDRLSQVPTISTGPVPQSTRPQYEAQSTTTPAKASSRQSTKGNDFVSRFSSRRMSQDTEKAKSVQSSKRQSKRSSKPADLKYFTYDDVAPGEPPVFGEEPPRADGTASRASRSIKGKERDSAVIEEQDDVEPEAPRAPVEPPRLAELPQRLSHMDMTGTGLSRKPTTDREAPSQRKAPVAAPVAAPIATSTGAQSQLAGAPAPAPVPAPPAHRQPKTLTATHGLDFSDIPGAKRGQQQGVPPPVNMSTKPPSKRPSREFKGGAAMAAGGTGAAAGAIAGLAAARHNDATTAAAAPNANANNKLAGRTSSFHEHLNDDVKPQPSTRVPAQASSAATQPIPNAATKPTDGAPTLAQEAQRETFLPPTPVTSQPLAQKPSELPAQELEASATQQPVVTRPREALAAEPPSQSQTPRGSQTPRVARRVAPPPPQAPAQAQAQAQNKATATPLGQMGADAQQDVAFVSAPSTPFAEVKNSALAAPPAKTRDDPPSAEEVIANSKYDSADTTVSETVAPAVVHETIHNQIKHVREERITREIHTYDIFHRVQPIIDVEVLSTRHFLATHDRGLIEVGEKDVPGYDASKKPAWKITPSAGNAADRNALLEGRYGAPAATGQGVREETKSWTHPDGYPVTETTHIHPPVMYTGGIESGKTVPFHFDHASGQAGFLPPGVPAPGVTRTRGNSITKSVNEAADDLDKIKLQDARSVPMTAHSGATQTVNAGPRDGQAGAEHLSRQNI